MAIMESRREGTCNECKGPIAKGELIEWNRNSGAKHYRNPDCVPQLATEEQLKAYQAAVLKEIKGWDGKGFFQPTDFGSWLDKQA